MKLKAFVALICLASFFFSGCALTIPNDENKDALSVSEEYVKLISDLEKKLDKLSEQHSVSDKENLEKIEDLQSQIENILKENEEDESNDTTVITEEKFSYTVNEKGALITGYSGKTDMIVIPSHIDGIKVYGIGESAFSFSEIKTVVISEGVEYIDWFAFFNSPFLESVTIPSSVTKIAYSAFDGVSSTLVIHCNASSYAHSYAQSYGISFVLV